MPTPTPNKARAAVSAAVAQLRAQDQTVKSAKDKNTPDDPTATAKTTDNSPGGTGQGSQTVPTGGPVNDKPVPPVGDAPVAGVGDPLPEGATPSATGTPDGDPNSGPGSHKSASAAFAQRFKEMQAAAGLAPAAGAAADTTKSAAEGATAQTGAAPAAKTEAEVRTAFGDNALVKIACAMLATDEGMAAAETILSGQIGAENAGTMIKMAADAAANEMAQENWVKQAAEQNQIDFKNYLDSLPTQEARENAVKKAHRLSSIAEAFPKAHIKLAFANGAAVGDDMMNAAGGEVPPPEAVEAAMGGGGDVGAEPSIEEIAAAIESLVAKGLISPEEAQALFAELQGGGGTPEEVKSASRKALGLDAYLGETWHDELTAA